MNPRIRLLALLLPACSPPPIPGATGGGAAGAGGAGGGGGHSETCCATNPDGGRIGFFSTCYCPGNYSCNFGLGVVDCGQGTCAENFPPRDGGACTP